MEIIIWIVLAVILILYVVVVPFLNQRKIKQDQQRMKEFQSRLQVGDEIVMTNGIHGKIKSFRDDTALIEIASNVVIQIERTVIVGVKH